MADTTISQLNSLTPGNGFIPVSMDGTTGKADMYVPHYPHILTSNGRIQNYSIAGSNVTIAAGAQIVITGIKYTLPAVTIAVAALNALFWQPGIGYTVGAPVDEPGFDKVQLFYNDSEFNRIVPLCNKSSLNAWKSFFIECVKPPDPPVFTFDGYGFYGGLTSFPSSDGLYDGYHARNVAVPNTTKSTVLNLMDPNLGTDYQYLGVNPTDVRYQFMSSRVWLYWGRAPKIVNHSTNTGYFGSSSITKIFYHVYANESFRYIESTDQMEILAQSGCADIHAVLMASG